MPKLALMTPGARNTRVEGSRIQRQLRNCLLVDGHAQLRGGGIDQLGIRSDRNRLGRTPKRQCHVLRGGDIDRKYDYVLQKPLASMLREYLPGGTGLIR